MEEVSKKKSWVEGGKKGKQKPVSPIDNREFLPGKLNEGESLRPGVFVVKERKPGGGKPTKRSQGDKGKSFSRKVGGKRSA